MQLTIIPTDAIVYKNQIPISNLDLQGCGIPIIVHALQWQEDKGWIEFVTNVPNELITELPQWALNCVAIWDIAYKKQINPPPPPPPTAEENKQWASALLNETDWTTIPDVSDPTKSNPYLGNAQEYAVYRNAIRQYAINPVAGNIDWATKPKSLWLIVN